MKSKMEAYEWLSRVYPWFNWRGRIWAMQSPTTSELHLGTTQTDVQRPSGEVQLPQTYQFLQCFKCCFLRIEQAKRKARTCSTCIPGVRSVESSVKENRLG